MEYQQQVPQKHYSFDRYFFPARWMSYYYQTREIVRREDIKSILNVGPGTTFLKDVLRIHRPDITYKTLDIASDLDSDYHGSITHIPLDAGAFDVTCAFQVLEHIEFADFEKALLELKRVSRKYVFVSLPHFGPSIEFLIKVPLIPRIRFSVKIPFYKRHIFQGQHYWEIGKKGYSVKKIRSVLERHFNILDEYVPFENQYHRFYIMEKI